MRVNLLFLLVFPNIISGAFARDYVVPKPVLMESGGQAAVRLDATASIVCADPVLAQMAGRVIAMHTGLYLDAGKQPAKGSRLVIHVDSAHAEAGSLGPEGYLLDVAKGRGAQASSVVIRSSGKAGAFYGLQTLAHLLRIGKGGEIYLTPARIADKPRFAWRGLFLDGELCFLDKQDIKRLLDLMAFYKLNVLHWRLAGDDAWRLEIKRYPNLTAADRFYTQMDMREIVAHAAARHIHIVPELSLPLHDYAFEQGVSPAAAMPQNNELMVDGILEELCLLFPSPYLHVRTVFSLRDGLAKLPMSGGSFVAHNTRYINELKIKSAAIAGKNLFSKNRRNMFWEDRNYLLLRTMDVKAVDGKNDASVRIVRHHDLAFLRSRLPQDPPFVVPPDFYLRFDYVGEEKPIRRGRARRGFAFLEHVYKFPEVVGISPSESFLGYEALCFPAKNFSLAEVEYILFPRMLALAELCWTPGELCEWEDFRKRILNAVHKLDILRVNYCKDAPISSVKTE